MWLAPSLVYWTSLGVVAYTYAGYPLAAWALSRVRPRRERSAPAALPDAALPSVSVVLAAHDEASRIAAKLDNLRALDYPADKLEIFVVSDGSTDGTDDVVAEYARASADGGRGDPRVAPRVTLVRVPEPSGKPTALNRGVAAASGELVLFCDARQDIEPGALRALVRRFADPDVGAASGELHMPGDKGPGMYWRYEKLIRAAESRLDSTVGATGALYAIRRALFRELPPGSLLDDMFTPMQIALRGYRVVFEPDARVFDVETSTKGEFARKARTLAGNFQLLTHLPRLLDPRKNRLLPQYVSHKLMRLVCPFALTSLFASNVVLVATGAPGWPLYVATLAGQLAGYGLAIKGAIERERAGPLARLGYTFVVLNAAAVEGLRRFVAGDLAWTGARREYRAATGRAE